MPETAKTPPEDRILEELDFTAPLEPGYPDGYDPIGDGLTDAELRTEHARLHGGE